MNLAIDVDPVRRRPSPDAGRTKHAAPECLSAQADVRMRQGRDDEALLHLVNEECFRHGASHFEPLLSLDAMRAWLASLGDIRFEVVAEVDGELVGFGGLYVFPLRRSHAGWLFLGVREKFQGRGIGERLLRTLIAAADILFGLGRVELTVYVDNEQALNLYRKSGFEIEGRLRNFVRRGEDFIDAYAMARIRSKADPPNSREDIRTRIERLSAWVQLPSGAAA